MKRRSFLGGLIVALAAPAIIRTPGLLMPIKPQLILPGNFELEGYRLDPAMIRPGRFDAVVEIPLPEEPERSEIFAVHLRGKPVSRSVKISELAARSAGFSGAQIASVCNLAALQAVRRVVAEAGGSEAGRPPLKTPAKLLIEPDDLVAALAEVAPQA